MRPRRGSKVCVTEPARWVHSLVTAMMPSTGSSHDWGRTVTLTKC